MLELLGQFFQTVGEFKEVYTYVDFYQYIKGVEYLICVAFFVGFPMYYKHVISAGSTQESRKKTSAEH
jgi:hypothetical protein